MGIIEGAIPRDAIRQAVVAGGAAGDHEVTGIKPSDRLVSVLHAKGGAGELDEVEDLTAEFEISAVDEIDNDDGTATTNGQLIVTWLSVA